jgi:cysteine-rich repeat protein
VLPGDTEVFLVNSAPAPFPGPPGAGVVADVMRFDVQNLAGDTDPVPPSLRAFVPLDENDAVVHRDFELMNSGATQCSDFRWEIVSMVDGNPIGSAWNDITEYPELDTVEVWRFINRSGMTHPMHLHQKEFQVLDRQDFTIVDDEIVPTGSPSPPAPEEAGPKDTIQVHPLEMVRIIKRFEDYTGRFAYHCHILEHEDQEMMRQFQTIQCGNAELEPTEECDDGNTIDGDGCSARCEFEDTLLLHGVAEGGNVTVTLDGVVLVVPTSPGETDSQVAAAIAAAIEADPTLAAAGVTAYASGPTVISTGTFDAVVINDPGLAVPAAIPAVAPWGLFAIGSALAGAALWRRRRGAAAQVPDPPAF